MWSQDLQGGGYSNINQLQYDTQSVSNSGQFIVWSQAFLSIPYTISATNMTGNVAGSVLWKNSYWNMIESVQISCQNKTVNNLCSKTNMAQTVRAIINPDINKAYTSLPTYGYYKDTAESNVVSGSSPNFLISNNVISQTSLPTATGAYSSLYSATNFGALERAKRMCFQPDSVTCSNTTLANTYRNFSTFAGTTQSVHGIAIIPLKYISDFFSEANLGMPLHNLRMYLQCNISQGHATYTVSGKTTSASTFPFQTVPIMITDVGSANVASVGSSVVSLQIGTYNGSTTPTRLYYPTVQLEASTEAKLHFPLKKLVSYRDVQFFTLPGVTAGANFNWQISNAIPGLKRLFIIPLIASSVQGTTNASQPSWASLTSSTPGTADPNMSLSNISLQINTRQVWSNNVLYDYEAFIQQILPNRLNGDTSAYVAGSVLSQYDWLTSYRFYVFDCSKVPSLQNVTANTPVNVQLLATNNSLVPMDLFAWCEVQTDVVERNA